MHEDISNSGDGGIYAEMIRNRAFQGSRLEDNNIVPYGPTLDAWRPVGGADISLSIIRPLSDALPTVLQLTIPWNATGEVGVQNEGWWGIDVRPQTYDASFYIQANEGSSNGSLSAINLSLRSNLTDDVWATTSLPFSPGKNISTFDWQQYSASIENTATAPNSNNTFAITMDAEEVAGNVYYISLVSLFPPTYKDRPNGIRRDLGEAVAGVNSKFLRFPGGNNLEGYSVAQRWKWNETIGPLINRPGRIGDWGYYNTNGLGLLEYLEFCEDVGMEPLLDVYAGYSLNEAPAGVGTSYPEDRMGEVLQEVLDEIEFVTGDASTRYGALRAEYGHPEPFPLNFIEIGNEDWFSTTYPYRFPYMYNGIKAKYPDITIVSSQFSERDDFNISLPAGTIWDYHNYQEPSFFLRNFDFWDNWQEETGNDDVGIFIGEYSVFQYDTPCQVVNFSQPEDRHVFWPQVLSAIGEGIFLLGAERNPNVVRMTAYAPSFVNLNNIQWTPDLVAYTADPDETVLSSSWYLQSLFSSYRGTETLPVVTEEGDFNPLWWAATIDETANAIYFKVVNSANSSIPLTIDLDVPISSVNGSILVSGSAIFIEVFKTDAPFRPDQTSTHTTM